MRKKCQEFMDVKQGGWSMHDYSKLFNHLSQYVSHQVDTHDKKKDRFMIDLSTKLQERMALNMGGHSQSLLVMSSSRTMQSTHTRTQRRGRS
jgi:hypothetical protein